MSVEARRETAMNTQLEAHLMTNAELIRHFEADALPRFHHADHVRLAFAYLSEYPPLEALEKFVAALKRYADARGKSQLYNETVTHAYFFLIRERMARDAGAGWDGFAHRNPDLLVWKNGILTRYYQETTLRSDLARSVFLFPDKCVEARDSTAEAAVGFAAFDGAAESRALSKHK